MKKFMVLSCVFLLAFAALPAAAQARQPVGAVSLVLTNSIAFAGLGAEVFLGNVGLGATFTMLPFSNEEVFLFFYEPGFYGRFYMGNPGNAFYLNGGLTYFGLLVGDKARTEDIKVNLVNINAGVGYNAFFGEDAGVRFSFEIGPRYTYETESKVGFVFFHTMIMFGKAF